MVTSGHVIKTAVTPLDPSYPKPMFSRIRVIVDQSFIIITIIRNEYYDSTVSQTNVREY